MSSSYRCSIFRAVGRNVSRLCRRQDVMFAAFGILVGVHLPRIRQGRPHSPSTWTIIYPFRSSSMHRYRTALSIRFIRRRTQRVGLCTAMRVHFPLIQPHSDATDSVQRGDERLSRPLPWPGL
ncbi:hypothetical protein OH77DRAFT_501304 [Trametes cingulata]|nr:hypothetical protein OH77DRAFT_501304 [Trametes cingulata]